MKVKKLVSFVFVVFSFLLLPTVRSDDLQQHRDPILLAVRTDQEFLEDGSRRLLVSILTQPAFERMQFQVVYISPDGRETAKENASEILHTVVFDLPKGSQVTRITFKSFSGPLSPFAVTVRPTGRCPENTPTASVAAVVASDLDFDGWRRNVASVPPSMLSENINAGFTEQSGCEESFYEVPADCSDSDFWTNPGQLNFFSFPSGNGFDYDCDRKEESQRPLCVAGVSDGWLGSTPPCGTVGAVGQSRTSGCIFSFSDFNRCR